eukprot:CAMPEP_0184403956 /NCGR_PEP_ID=MMETSP0007-20130409/85683_1 /TAXON_ID=97485 /ORGANISM="Prymnesium parvum, Strain Texoma1" /LENGTH=547 /DNA_ID=CAMNT_0026760089 /DNA_START=772 /DNA_END=2411 /DNA_ORIENTATION=-
MHMSQNRLPPSHIPPFVSGDQRRALARNRLQRNQLCLPHGLGRAWRDLHHVMVGEVGRQSILQRAASEVRVEHLQRGEVRDHEDGAGLLLQLHEQRLEPLDEVMVRLAPQEAAVADVAPPAGVLLRHLRLEVRLGELIAHAFVDRVERGGGAGGARRLDIARRLHRPRERRREDGAAAVAAVFWLALLAGRELLGRQVAEVAEALCEEEAFLRQLRRAGDHDSLRVLPAAGGLIASLVGGGELGAQLRERRGGAVHVRRAHEEDGAVADVDGHHVRDERLGKPAVDVVKVELGGEVEQLDVRHVLLWGEGLVLRLVLADPPLQVLQCLVLGHALVVGRVANLLQQVALECVRLRAHRLDEEELALRKMLLNRVVHRLPPRHARVGRVEDGDARGAAILRTQPLHHLDKHTLRQLLPRGQVGDGEEAGVVERAIRLQLLPSPLANVEDANGVASPDKIPLELFGDEGLPPRRQPDERDDDVVGIWSELRSDPTTQRCRRALDDQLVGRLGGAGRVGRGVLDVDRERMPGLGHRPAARTVGGERKVSSG